MNKKRQRRSTVNRANRYIYMPVYHVLISQVKLCVASFIETHNSALLSRVLLSGTGICMPHDTNLDLMPPTCVD